MELPQLAPGSARTATGVLTPRNFHWMGLPKYAGSAILAALHHACDGNLCWYLERCLQAPMGDKGMVLEEVRRWVHWSKLCVVSCMGLRLHQRQRRVRGTWNPRLQAVVLQEASLNFSSHSDISDTREKCWAPRSPTASLFWESSKLPCRHTLRSTISISCPQ